MNKREDKNFKNKKIGNVILNYSYYSEEDYYSDGDEVESLMLDIAKNGYDDKMLLNTDRWPVYCHLSSDREYIVDGMDIKKTDEVLEIGAGCGAITGALASRAKKVECIELSERRSKINAYKNINNDNIEIYVANYENYKTKKKYDVVTLIGVFEYAALYFHTSNPYEDFLTDVYRKLKKGGRLYIAIENKLGAKYFSGCVEDHTGKAFDGIEGYDNVSKAKTFSYYEWIQMLDKCGIKEYRFLYPYPDYKFPEVIYTDDFLPNSNTSFKLASNYYSKRRIIFNEDRFLRNLCMSEEYKIFTNSFLICITKKG